jgi:predicted NAD/FAD-binding protein
VTVFESRSKIGGHCDSQELDYHGTPITVDLGAQFFHPDTHPIYTDVFKSWAQRRAADPADVLFERHFQHPLITPEVIRVTRALHATQGRNGLYFCGQHTTGMDLQEASVVIRSVHRIRSGGIAGRARRSAELPSR